MSNPTADLPAATTARLASPPGKGGIAIIILSGPRTDEIIGRYFRQSGKRPPSPDSLLLGEICDGDELIDQAVICRPAKNVAEINIHGGPIVAARTLQLLSAGGAVVVDHPQPGEAGQFCRSHDKWRNPAIGTEMLAEINNAQSPLALACLTGQWSAGISELAAQTIAAIDKPTADLQPAKLAGDLKKAARLLPKMRTLLKCPEVVLAGAPNSGKSTLTNLLVGRPVSIVHQTPGTTRDWVRQPAVLDGVPINLTDTAGIWDAPAGTWADVEKQAVRRAIERAAAADLVVILRSADSPDEAIHAILNEGNCRKILRAWAKSDLHAPPADCQLAISAVTGDGVDRLKKQIVASLGLADLNPTEPMAFTDRQTNLLDTAAKKIRSNQLSSARQMLTALLEG